MKTEVTTHDNNHAAKNATTTILLAIGFLALVMFLSYVFISGTK